MRVRPPSLFACPRGPLGPLAGRVMALANAGINDLALDVLEVQPADQVLEVGFGPGAALAEVARRAPQGFVAGVEPSATMIAQASGRLRDGVAAGQVELKPGTATEIPYEDGRFDRVFTVNTIYFWGNEIEEALREMRRVTKRGGRFAVVFRAVADERGGVLRVYAMESPPSLEDVSAMMENAGFREVTIHRRQARFLLRRITAVAVVGTAA